MSEISNERPRRTGLRSAVIATAALGVGVTIGAAGIAGAATSPSPAPKGETAVAPDGTRPPRHPGGPGGGLLGALHGTLVVPDGTGTKTIDVQRGVITDVSSTSLTVKSTDGVTKTYTLDKSTVIDAGRDTAVSLARNDQVGVVSTPAGKATHVRDLTKLRAERRAHGPRGGWRRGGPPPGAPGAVPGDFAPDDAAYGGRPA